MSVKISIECEGGSESVAPSAVPRNGAEQGVATTVASRPEKNDPASPPLDCKPEPTPMTEAPISNRPAMFSAKMRKNAARK